MPWKDYKSDYSNKDFISKNALLMKKSTNDAIYRSRANSSSGIAESEHSVEAYMIRSKKAAGYLRQILHSQKCGGMCQNSSCIQTSRVFNHVVHCDVAMCSTQGCETTKKLLTHFHNCRSGQALRGLSSSGGNGHLAHSTCMICSIACSSSPTKILMPQQYNSNNLHADVMREDEEDTEETSFSSDEVIEFNRIPFQNNQIEARPKTFSDGFVVPTGAPRAKARSKSMNAMHVDEFSPL